MGKIKLFPSPTYEVKQPKDSIVPCLPMTGMLVGPSKSGKSTALVSIILEQYRGCFERVMQHPPIYDPRWPQQQPRAPKTEGAAVRLQETQADDFNRWTAGSTSISFCIYLDG